MNDLLEELICAADPGTVRRGDPLSERGLRELAKYQAKEAALNQSEIARARTNSPLRTHRRLEFASMGAVLALIIVATFSLTSVLHPATAIATTPPLLDLTPVNAKASDLLKTMENTCQAGPDRGNTIRTQTWALVTYVGDGGMIESSEVEPRWSETTFNQDGSVHYLLMAADPFPGQNGEDLPEPDTILNEETFSSAEWGYPFHEEPPSNAAEVGDYLARFAGTDSLTVGQLFREITSILSEYAINSDQEAALIGYLATLEGIDVAGSTKDRLGREGIVFRPLGEALEPIEDYLVISPATGRILASETIYIGTERTDIESPSVLDYTIWQ